MNVSVLFSALYAMCPYYSVLYMQSRGMQGGSTCQSPNQSTTQRLNSAGEVELRLEKSALACASKEWNYLTRALFRIIPENLV